MENSANPATVRGPVVLALGDSLTAGYGLRSRDSFAGQLEQRLQPDFPAARVINAGVSGDTSGMALGRLPTLMSGLREKPDLAIVQLGANDLIRGVPLPRIRANLENIIIDLRRIGIPVLLAQMDAPSFLGSFGKACSAIYSDLAARHEVTSHSFLPAGILGNPAFCLADRIHPNAKGVAAIVDGFLPAVTGALSARARNAA